MSFFQALVSNLAHKVHHFLHLPPENPTMPHRFLALALCLMLPVSAFAAGKVYRCTDARGIVTFSNINCPSTPVARPAATPAPVPVAASVSPAPSSDVPRLEQVEPLAPLKPQTLAEVNSQCQARSQEISSRYTRELDGIDTEIFAIAREGRSRTPEGEARLNALRSQRESIDGRSRAERGVLVEQCEKDRAAVRAALASAPVR